VIEEPVFVGIDLGHDDKTVVAMRRGKSLMILIDSFPHERIRHLLNLLETKGEVVLPSSPLMNGQLGRMQDVIIHMLEKERAVVPDFKLRRKDFLDDINQKAIKRSWRHKKGR